MEQLNFIKGLGVKSILIINNDGLPIFDYHFDVNSLLKENTIILSSFFSAFNSFAESLLLSYLSDFGIQDQRLFYKYYSDFFFIVGVDSLKLNSKSFYDIREFVDVILWHLTQEFTFLFERELSSFKAWELYREITTNYLGTILRYIYKGCKDWSDTIAGIPAFPSSVKPLDPLPDINNASYTDLTFKFGLEAVYVLNNDLLIYEQIFNEAIKIEGELLSDLFRAINTFASTQFGLILTEIGLFNNRVFYKRDGDQIFLFLVNDLINFSRSVKQTQNIVEKLIDRLIPELKKKFTVEEVDKDKDLEDLYKRVLDFEI